MAERNKKRMVYLILHYNTIEATRECVASIRNMESYSDCAMVIVDNASPDGSGTILRDEYAPDERITVLLNQTNAGFSEGNNLGYRYIREHYDADFITVCNNDIVFQDRDYPEKIEAIYKEEPFSVMGPDVYNPRLGIHQSPLGKTSPDQKAVCRTIILNQLADRFFPLFWILIGKRDAKKRFVNRKDSMENYQEKMNNVPLMGACLILSGEFIHKYEQLFQPSTFLYYEEFLLYNRCMRDGEKMLYQPKIQVQHYEGRATITLSANDRERYRRLVKNTLAASRIYFADLKENPKRTENK